MQTQTRRSTRPNGQVYREFSRKRYRQLKAASTHMRESEIVQKIIREWENLSDEQKNKFVKTLENNANLPEEGVENTPRKKDRALKIAKTNQKTTGAKESPVEEPSESEENQREDSSSKNILFPKAPKKIRKLGSTEDYMTFFKFYYEKTMKDHPNWTPNQATVIIKLLWKKRKQQQPGLRRSIRLGNVTNSRSTRHLSGRQAFSKAKKALGHSADEITKMWKHLPMESRKEWDQKGDPSIKRNEPFRAKATMRLPLSKQLDSYQEGNGLNFLNYK